AAQSARGGVMSDATIILNPQAAAAEVCHDEQMIIWTSEFAEMLSLGGWLRSDFSYSDGVELQEAIGRELRSVIECAFDHPEARTIKRRGAPCPSSHHRRRARTSGGSTRTFLSFICSRSRILICRRRSMSHETASR